MTSWKRYLRAACAAGLVLFAAFSGHSAETGTSATNVLRAVVGIEATVPETARTARSLGTKREGGGVIIGEDGLVLTIGYLIMEAVSASVIGPDGTKHPATIVAYDNETGFGLLRASTPLGVAPVTFGDSTALKAGDRVLAISREGARPVTPARVVSRRQFAGYWEYLLESAIFTSPPHSHYGGAGLFDEDGRLLGIGSLFVNDAVKRDHPVPGNMFVPIDILKPVLGDLVKNGRPLAPHAPWLGVYTDNFGGRVIIQRLAGGGPGEKAGLKPGDFIIGVNGKRVSGMIDYFQKLRANGPAGTDVTLDILPRGSLDLTIKPVVLRSVSRYDWLKLKTGM